MMNSNKSPIRNLYRFVLVLPLIVAAYFAVNPLMANPPSKIYMVRTFNELKDFVGYYQFEKDKDAYIQILIKGNNLVLKQMWDKEEITFEQKSDLEFYNKEHDFPLKFTRANGTITQVLAFSKDVWNKVKEYKPVIKKEVQLTSQQIKAFEGSYKLNGNEDAYLQMTAIGNNLVVKEMWSGKEIIIAPESETDFFGKDMRYPVKFSKDDRGGVKEALIFNKDVWVKVK